MKAGVASRSITLPLLMGGILFPWEEGTRLVTLTIHPNQECAPDHNRMPKFVDPEHLDQWLSGAAEEGLKLVVPPPNGSIYIVS